MSFAGLIVLAASLAGCVENSDAVRPYAYSVTDPQVASTIVATRAPGSGAPHSQGQYIAEFKARTGPDFFGHSYLVFGRLGTDGEIVDPVHTGLYPDNPTGFAFAVGGARATTESVGLDKMVKPNVVFRHELSHGEYTRLSAAVEKARENPPSWSWTNYNCNTYLADLAHIVGLKTPTGGTWMAPSLFIAQMKDLNS